MNEEETVRDAIETWYSYQYATGFRMLGQQRKSLANFIIARLALESTSVMDGCDDE